MAQKEKKKEIHFRLLPCFAITFLSQKTHAHVGAWKNVLKFRESERFWIYITYWKLYNYTYDNNWWNSWNDRPTWKLWIHRKMTYPHVGHVVNTLLSSLPFFFSFLLLFVLTITVLIVFIYSIKHTTNKKTKKSSQTWTSYNQLKARRALSLYKVYGNI